MKIGVMADIHGNIAAFEAVWQALSREVDRVLFLGDLCGYYPFVEECVRGWDARRIIAVRGNHDEMLLRCLEQRTGPPASYETVCGSALARTLARLSPTTEALIRSWPLTQSLVLGGRRLFLCHGTPQDPLEGRLYPDAQRWEGIEEAPGDIILLGQTHYAFHRWVGNKLVINPGSVGQPRDRRRGACYAILELSDASVELRRIPYDPAPMIEDARQHNPQVPYLVEALAR